jgi:hypothetical protein
MQLTPLIAVHMTATLLAVAVGLVAGGFTLLPGRYLGNLVWHQWLGLA